jgi:hypothetical protein
MRPSFVTNVPPKMRVSALMDRHRLIAIARFQNVIRSIDGSRNTNATFPQLDTPNTKRPYYNRAVVVLTKTQRVRNPKVARLCKIAFVARADSIFVVVTSTSTFWDEMIDVQMFGTRLAATVNAAKSVTTKHVETSFFSFVLKFLKATIHAILQCILGNLASS